MLTNDVLGNITNEQLEMMLQVQKGSKGMIKPMISTGITSGNIGPRRGTQSITIGSVREDFQGIRNQFERDMQPISERFFQSCLDLIERNRERSQEQREERKERREGRREKRKTSLKSRLQSMKEKWEGSKANNPLLNRPPSSEQNKTGWMSRFRRFRPQVKGVSSDALRFLQSLPAANWEKKFGARPTVPGWPYIPKTCPRSIFTNLKRIFFSGVNVLAGLDQLISQGRKEDAKKALEQLGTAWNQWLDTVERYHGNPDVIAALKKVNDYLFKQTDIEEFKELFNKYAFAAVNPQRFLQIVKSHFGGIKGGSLSRR